MQPLIDQLIAQRGISAEQAKGVLTTIKEFIEENFPAFGNSLDGILTYNPITLKTHGPSSD